MHPMTRQFRYILAAAREGSVTAAAEAESISASSILSAIEKFESYYKTTIFVRRRSKGLTTTITGRRILARMRQVLDDIEAFETDLKQATPKIAGELRLGVFATMAAHVMPHILKSLHGEHPDLRVIHFEGSLREVEADLRSGKVDVALTYDAFIPDDLEVLKILDAPPHALLSEDDPLATDTVVSIDDLAKRPLILLDSPDSAQYILSLFTRSGHRPIVHHRTTSYELIRSSVALGLGASVLNIRPLVDTTYSGKSVVCRPLSMKSDSLASRVAVVTRKGDVLGARVRAFIEHCRRFSTSATARQLVVDGPG
ncbi:MAG: LysR substrate-binding domain-containing protein [Pseudomonadota bacterium]